MIEYDLKNLYKATGVSVVSSKPRPQWIDDAAAIVCGLIFGLMILWGIL